MSQFLRSNPELLKSYKQLVSELDSTILRLQRAEAKMGEIETLVFDTVLAELQSAKITGYNASIAYANLINSVCKLQRVKLEIIDRLNNTVPAAEPEDDEQSVRTDPKMQRAAEKLLVEVVKQQLAHDKTAVA